MKEIIDNKKGFTMIELLMVILLIAVLGAVAVPQFLDFRQEGRAAAARAILGAVRTGVKLQRSQAILRCGADNNYYPSLAALTGNDVTIDETCTTGEVSSTQDRKFIEEATIPANPFNANEGVVAGSTKGCGDTGGSEGWRYNVTTGEFWANSSTEGIAECDF
jgi:prepilin-type N-terminal cleavage/methylation domain-containing protein